MTHADLLAALGAAQAGDWHRAHAIVQRDEADLVACRIHAVLHKIEGDAGNSRYWYARSGYKYEDFADVGAELAEIRREIAPGSL